MIGGSVAIEWLCKQLPLRVKIYTIRGWKTMIDLEVAELILDLSNPQLNYGFLLLNEEPMEANLAYKDMYNIAKKRPQQKLQALPGSS